MLNCRESQILLLAFRHRSSGCQCSGFVSFWVTSCCFQKTCPLSWMLSYSLSLGFLTMKLLLKEESNSGESSWWFCHRGSGDWTTPSREWLRPKSPGLRPSHYRCPFRSHCLCPEASRCPATLLKKTGCVWAPPGLLGIYGSNNAESLPTSPPHCAPECVSLPHCARVCVSISGSGVSWADETWTTSVHTHLHTHTQKSQIYFFLLHFSLFSVNCCHNDGSPPDIRSEVHQNTLLWLINLVFSHSKF